MNQPTPVIYLCRCESTEDWDSFVIVWCDPKLCSCFCHAPEHVTGQQIIEAARKYTGVPYQWSTVTFKEEDEVAQQNPLAQRIVEQLEQQEGDGAAPIAEPEAPRPTWRRAALRQQIRRLY